MHPLLRAIPMVLMLLLVPAGWAGATTTVRVVETWPAGDSVTLARQQNYYLRLAWASDTPVGIWVEPFHRGKPVKAGTSTSLRYSGEGEAFVSFFLWEPGDEVDEVRIKAGNGGVNSTPVVARYAVHVVQGSAPRGPESEPAWLARLQEHKQVAEKRARQEYESRTESAGTDTLIVGFLAGTVGLGLLGFVAPIWMAWRWEGGWRIAAAVPATMMIFVVLRIVVDVSRDPTSHNLLPFEILMAGATSAGVILLLMLLRRLSGAGRRRPA